MFCDASERAYGSVGYLRTEDASGEVKVAFIAARSRVAPKRQQSMPRLELCAALTGAQLATTLRRELTLDVRHVHMWTDSSTVLTWITSDSCRYKAFQVLVDAAARGLHGAAGQLRSACTEMPKRLPSQKRSKPFPQGN